MTVLRLAVAAAVLMVGVFCGTQEQAQTEQPAGDNAGEMPAVAFEPISEAEMDKFTGALPDVSAALKAAGYAPEEREEDELPQALARMVAGMGEVDGVKAALKKNGTAWPEFSGTMYKVMAASAALGLDMAIAMAAGFADDSEQGKEIQAELDKAKAFCERVPQGNREIIVQNMEKLEPLGDIN